MDRFLSDIEITDRVLDHIDKGTTDRSSEVWEEPVVNYQDSKRLEDEIEIIRRSLVPFCPSVALPEVGSYVARESAGRALLVVRGKDHKVRAFINACRHRGTQLVTNDGCTRALVCPYHGWAYNLDGSLQYIPHEDGFPDIDKSTKGLVELVADEAGGLVFVRQVNDGLGERNSGNIGTILDENQQLIRCNEGVFEANWKMVLEGFIEGYHIKYAHPETFYPFGYDNLNVIERNGLHSRVTYPFKRMEALAEVPPSKRKVDGKLTYVYHLFPNVLVSVLSHTTSTLILEPIDTERTRSITYTLTNRGDQAGAMDRANRDYEFVNNTGGEEDRALVAGIQRSIASNANEHFTFGHFESAITHFHKNMQQAVDHLHRVNDDH